jgi:signal transduction histidine kinase/ActR/RegA family two-component response regulator
MTGSLWRNWALSAREKAVDLAAPWCRGAMKVQAAKLPALSRRIQRQQFRTQLQQFPASVRSAGLGVVLWAAVLWYFNPGLTALLWTLAGLAHLVAMPTFLYRFRRAQPSDDELPSWEAASGRLNQLMNVFWGSAGFMAPQLAEFTPYVAIGTLMVMAGELSLYAVYRPSIAWVLPCPVLAMIFIVKQGTVLDVSIGLGLLVATALMMRLTRLQNTLMTQAQALAEERVALLAEVQGQRAAAQQANEAKTRFLAMVTHDLRQPMHSIALLSGAFGRGDSASDHQVMGQIGASVQAMDGMLGALLDVSRLDDGTLPLQVAPLSVGALLSDTSLQFAAQAREKGLDFRVDPSSAWVVSDGYQVQRVLANLVANAIRYTPQGGVSVRCRVRGALAWLQVWDTGLGIAREDRLRIFDEFVQVASRRGRDSPGLGLGLSIVQRVARRLGHPVRLRSRSGRGSMFAVGLPLDTASDQSSASDREVASLSLLLGGQLVLLIDDDAMVLASMRAWLSSFQCQVLAASSVAQALAAVDESLRTPDLILCDFRLCDATGLDAIATVRAHLGEQVPALLVTAEVDPARQAAQAHGVEVLAKPLQVHALTAALGRTVSATPAPW